MKVGEGLYYCPWCSIEFKKEINRIEGSGRKGVGVTPCSCPECNRLISQKTKIEMRSKIEKGFKI